MANIQPRYDRNGKLISYSIRVFRGRDASGKQLKPYTCTFPVEPGWTEKSAKKKAEAFAATYERDIKAGLTSDNRQKLSDYLDYFIELKESRGAKHRTVYWYKEQAEVIKPVLGHIKLKDLRADDLNRFYSQMLKTTVKPTTAKSMIDLKAILKERKITRVEIAKNKGLSENTVQIAVKGCNCSVETAKAICDYLGLSLEKSFLVVTENKTLSGKTVSGYHRLLSAVCKQAVKEGLIPINVAANAEVPKAEQKEIESLQPSELPAILAALEKEPLKWKTIVHLLMVTGCRRGEILGLRWKSVDLNGNQIFIDNNVLYAPDRGTYMDKPKTDSSIRWISIPAATTKLLKKWQKAQEADEKKKGAFYQNKEGLLFTQENGSPMCPDSLTSYLRKFSKKYNLPPLHPHLFRHSMASLLIYNHVDPVSVSKRLGHSQVSTTTDIYAHVIAEADKQNADILADIFLANG